MFRAARGFTLVELVVALVLLAILGSVGAARFFDVQGYRARGWRDDILITSRYARAVAVAARGQKVRLTFEAQRLHAVLAADCLAAAASTPIRSPGGSSALQSAAPAGVSLEVAGRTVPVVLCLDGLGRPLEATTAAGEALAAPLQLKISSQGLDLALTLEPETGFLHP
jgi:MSHA pilin protein MshC